MIASDGILRLRHASTRIIVNLLLFETANLRLSSLSLPQPHFHLAVSIYARSPLRFAQAAAAAAAR